MDLSFYPFPSIIDKETLNDSTVIVIDVLRATSTVIAAIENGAAAIIPVEDIETASKLVSKSDRDTKLLAGEWKGQPIEGFDLFNSPLEFTPERVKGKTVVFTTTNGTRAITAVSRARRILVCSINNVDAVAESIMGEKRIAIVCAGNSGGISGEDMLCGGMLIGCIGVGAKGEKLSDSARLALHLSEGHSGEIEAFLRSCDRGRELIGQGYGGDIEYCSRRGSSSIVPELIDGTIR